jgi:CBS domain-containing protein
MSGEPLPTLVRDLMTVGVTTCPPDTPISELAQLQLEKELEEIVVLSEGNALGVVGPDELVRALSSPDFRSLTAEQVMREGVPQVPPDIPLAAASQIMQDLGVRTLFLMHHAAGIEYPAAFITYRHFLRYLAARDSEDLRDLGIKAERQPPLDAFNQRRQAKLVNNNTR